MLQDLVGHEWDKMGHGTFNIQYGVRNIRNEVTTNQYVHHTVACLCVCGLTAFILFIGVWQPIA